jgi:hypothetical protein
MPDETQFTKPPVDDSTKSAESQLMSVSMRGWITVIVVCTICGMEIFKIGISEPLYSMSLIIVGFYFGQKAKPQPPTTPPTP